MSSNAPGGLTAAEHIAEGQRILADAYKDTLTAHEGHNPEADRAIAEAQAHFLAAQAINTLPAQDTDEMTDEELWNSPAGLRLRDYADKLLAAESERVGIVDKRQLAGHQRIGLDYGRDVLSVTGETTHTRNENDDPWTYWKSPEIEGLREAVAASDRTRKGAQEAAKAYIAKQGK